MKQIQGPERRYQQILRLISDSWLVKKLSAIWQSHVKYYSLKTWSNSKTIIWCLSTGAIIFLLPLALQSTLEAESQMELLSSQLGAASQTQYRPY